MSKITRSCLLAVENFLFFLALLLCLSFGLLNNSVPCFSNQSHLIPIRNFNFSQTPLWCHPPILGSGWQFIVYWKDQGVIVRLVLGGKRILYSPKSPDRFWDQPRPWPVGYWGLLRHLSPYCVIRMFMCVVMLSTRIFTVCTNYTLVSSPSPAGCNLSLACGVRGIVRAASDVTVALCSSCCCCCDSV